MPRKRVHNHGPSSSGIAIVVSTHKTAGRIYTRMTVHAHASLTRDMHGTHTYIWIANIPMRAVQLATKTMPVSFAIAEGSLGNSKNRFAVSRYLPFITFM